MIIENVTKKTKISSDAKLADSFGSRVKGLMMTTKPQTLVLVSPHEGISDSSIHMWFMRQAIDVIWLDEEFKVVDVYETAKPWAMKIFRPKKAAKYVVECPPKTIEKTKTTEKDVFSFKKAKSV